ncbi:Aste57867_10748 [Aphanomyces stellatus]|uniref:Aste57867_10748 protein n=1 Tax=Aphanomyces stellatus TaxID=120398 RepID=A0A485KRM0_9STRA|nr:hypothetical protein As57867_010708 [Aphanomyces stellatus]VFT87618.1 Aste57867_10748 [Aphanomyces stellatus]
MDTRQASLPSMPRSSMAGALGAVRQLQDDYGSLDVMLPPPTSSSSPTAARKATKSKAAPTKLPPAGTSPPRTKSIVRGRKNSSGSLAPLVPDALVVSDTTGTFSRVDDATTVTIAGSFLDDNLATPVAIEFQLAGDLVAHDNAQPFLLPLDEMMEAQAAAVGALPPHPEVDITTSVVRSQGSLPLFNVVVKGKVKESVGAANKLAWETAREAKKAFLDARFYMERKKDSLAPDYDRLYKHYAPLVASVVAALRQSLPPNPSPRVFAGRALAFTQSLPYEKAEGGFRRPLSVLTELRGNCGSKTTLFLALMHHAFPTLEKCVCCVPHHVFGGIKIDKVEGDTMVGDDNQFVAVEPVGPGRLKVGQTRAAALSARHAKKAEPVMMPAAAGRTQSSRMDYGTKR